MSEPETTPKQGDQPKPKAKPVDPILKALEDKAQPFILIRLPNKSVLIKDRKGQDALDVQTNLIPEMFTVTITQVLAGIQQRRPT